jgi:hypothetical protein
LPPVSRDDARMNHLPLEGLPSPRLGGAVAAPFAIRAEFAASA